jgi:ankyrin repeat protein
MKADFKLTTPLHLAIDRGHEDIAVLLIEEGPGVVNAQGSDSSTPLFYAANGGLDRVTKELLQSGADPNIACSNGCTPLMFAAEKGHLKVVTSLCEGGANILAENDHGSSCLHFAAQWGHADCVRYLLKRAGVAQLAARGHARTALMTACEYGQLEAAQALLDSGAVSAAELSLAAAVHCDDEATAVQLCRALLAKGAAVDATECGRTALALAAMQGKPAVAVLLRAGADVTAVCIDSDGLATSVLQYAVMTQCCYSESSAGTGS